jgi:SAM-dependent methyltransferase
MLDDCKSYLTIARCSRFAYDIVDAQDIPFSTDRFDVVIANHMLYHVPDRPAALAEIRRVLKPDGVLLATTIGKNHLCELMELAEKFIPPLVEERDDYGFITGNFSLENGSKQLKSVFKSVRIRRFSDGLKVTETQPLMDYIGSMMRVPGEAIIQKNGKKLQMEIKKRIKADGAINITKDSGLFIATGG